MAYNTIQEERKHSLQMKTIVVIIQRINNLFLFFYKKVEK